MQILVMAIVYLFRNDLATNPAALGLVNVLAFAVTCTVAGRAAGYPLGEMLAHRPPPGTFAPWNVVALVQAVLGQLFCSVGIIYAIGGKGVEKSEYVERLNTLLGPGQALWTVIPLLVIVAPFTEEILFRGQFLRGFLGRYGPGQAIALSALLFSAVHLNPVQIPATFMLGVLSGFLYLRTRSIWPSIFAHMVNNSFPAIAVIGASRAKQAAKATELSVAGALGLIALGLSIWLLALFALRKWLPPHQPEPTPTPVPVSFSE